MDLSNAIEHVNILNVDKTLSCVPVSSIVIGNDDGFIISDADEELLISIEFTQFVNLHSLKIKAITNENDTSTDASPPKLVHIYKTDNSNINFNDLSSMKPDKSITCSAKKLSKGQNIKLQKETRNTIKFKNIKYLIIYVESNQGNTDNTFINFITFKGTFEEAKKIDFTSRPKKRKPGFHLIPQDPEPDAKHKIKTESTMCYKKDKPNSTGTIANCTHLKQLSLGLKYYHHLLDNDMSKQKLISFSTEYNTLLADYIHFIKEHASIDELIQIEKELRNIYGFKKCDLKTCKKVKRHYRLCEDEKKDNEDGTFELYSDFYDRFHHHIFHLFEMGLRLDPSLIQESEEEEEQKTDLSYVDRVLEKRKRFLKLRKKETEMDIQRYDQNNKFIFHVNCPKHNETVTDDGTCLDALYLFIAKEINYVNCTSNELKSLIQYLTENEYDTDIVKYDVDDCIENENTSNIYMHVNNLSIIQIIQKYFQNLQLSVNSFSTGFLFFYDKDAKNYTEKEAGDLLDGYAISDLYVSQYYDSLKQEILCSQYLSFSEWKHKIVQKGKLYYQTNSIKRLKAYENRFSKERTGEQISLSNIYCVMLYCDWSDLCTEFSATYRINGEFEPIKSVIQRHSKYYHLGKGLRECALIFGINGHNLPEYDDEKNRYVYTHNKYEYERGPFFSGLSFVAKMPYFAIHLKGPCSTTKEIDCAINFATRDGIIIELQNDQGNARTQRFFDCSWISKYSAENERLFMSGQFRLRIVSIRIIETSQNFERFLHTMYVFDAMISGVDSFAHAVYHDGLVDVLSSDVSLLDKLISTALNSTYQQTVDIDQYILDTFNLFRNKKTALTIHMLFLDTNFPKISHFLMHSVGKTSRNGKSTEETKDIADNKLLNVLNTKILEIFPNLQQVEINTSHTRYNVIFREYNEYKFDLLSFLSSIESFKPSITYGICAEDYYAISEERFGYSEQRSQNWLNEIDQTTIDTFNQKNWNIKHEKIKGDEDNFMNPTIDYIIISKCQKCKNTSD
eukprot:516196_1